MVNTKLKVLMIFDVFFSKFFVKVVDVDALILETQKGLPVQF